MEWIRCFDFRATVLRAPNRSLQSLTEFAGFPEFAGFWNSKTKSWERLAEA